MNTPTTTSTPVSILLSSPSRWIKGTFARKADQTACKPTDNDAACWCLAGALRRCYPDHEVWMAVHARIKPEIKDGIYSWNDDPKRTFAEVRTLVEKLGL